MSSSPNEETEPKSQQQDIQGSNQDTTNQTTSTLSRSGNLLSSLLNFAFGDLGSYKMIFLVNHELNMGRGKQCAQVAHAALGLYIKVQESSNEDHKLKMHQWICCGQKKVVVKTSPESSSMEQMLSVQQLARASNLPNLIITDAGRTQVDPGSKTVLSIFGSNEELDRITGSFKLL